MQSTQTNAHAQHAGFSSVGEMTDFINHYYHRYVHRSALKCVLRAVRIAPIETLAAQRSATQRSATQRNATQRNSPRNSTMIPPHYYSGEGTEECLRQAVAAGHTEKQLEFLKLHLESRERQQQREAAAKRE